MKTIDAIYESGTLRPSEALQLREREKVRILILPSVDSSSTEPSLPRTLPPGLGAFESGHSDTAERAEEILTESGFGESRGGISEPCSNIFPWS